MDNFINFISSIPNEFKIAHIFISDDVYDTIECLRLCTLNQIMSPVVNDMLITDCSLTVCYLIDIMGATKEETDHLTDNCLINMSDDINHTFLYINGYIIQSFSTCPLKCIKIEKTKLTEILTNLNTKTYKQIIGLDDTETLDNTIDDITIEYYDIKNYKTDTQTIKDNLKIILSKAEYRIINEPNNHFLQLFAKEITPNDLHITIYDEDPNLDKSIMIAKDEISRMYAFLEKSD